MTASIERAPLKPLVCTPVGPVSGGDEPRYDVATVAEKTGVTAHTLRYWERAGLVAPPFRDSAGRRLYSETDVNRVVFVDRLRSTDMPVRKIREYVELVPDEHSVPRRLQMLREHRDVVAARLAEVTEHLRVIEHKIAKYEETV